MFDVRRLILLRELSIRGTLAAVAESMNFSPSAVSQQLALLEKEVGVELFRKAGRRVQLTPQAELLVASAGELVDTLERAEAAIEESLTTVRGRVRVAVFQSAALALMPSALRMMTTGFPDVRIEMVQHEPGQALHGTWARDFDLVIGEEYPAHSAPWLDGLDRQDLTGDAIELALPGVDQSLRPVTGLGDARSMPWVMEPEGTASRHFAEQICRRAGFEPDVRYETADLQAQIRLIESGNAVALMPELVWAGRPTSCRLIALEGSPRRTIFTAHRKSADSSPALKTFRIALEAAARQFRESRPAPVT